MRSPAVKLAVLFPVVLAACGAPESRSPPVPVPAHFREPADPAATAPSPNAVPSAFPPPADSGVAAAAQAAAAARRAPGGTALDRPLTQPASGHLDVAAATAGGGGGPSRQGE